ncbi:hypothetical protein QOZ80_3BG0264270 [Eleusine coracana subsp. coracana]|nr:hypothetical protein QOZ80_3BG0264270 [Eleusine coracana subsp. coracana]
MALSGAAECALSLACARWAARRLSISGSDESASWPAATPASFKPVPRACRAALAAYDADDSSPSPSPLCPPYRLLHDRERGEVVLAVRGLGLARPEDYRVLLDAGGPQPFAGGHAHRGLLRAAVWLLDREGPALQRMVAEARGGPGRSCRLVFVGHSLGAGVAALAAVVAVRCWLGRLGLRRGDVSCYAMAPPRCMSLGLAVEYADVVNSIVLQDDFLPRTPAPLQHIFGSIFCLPCLLCFICTRDTFVSQGKLTDPTKLYSPGRVFHIVERKNCRCGRFPPQVRTAVPTEGRFEHVVLSCNAPADHGIIWIEREAQKALDLMEKEDRSTSPPAQQKMLRAQSLNTKRDAIEIRITENQVFPKEETSHDDAPSSPLDSPSTSTVSRSTSSSMGEQCEWDELVETFLSDLVQGDDLRHGGNGFVQCCDGLPAFSLYK